MSLHGEEGDKQDPVRKLCTAAESFIYDFYHRWVEGSFMCPGLYEFLTTISKFAVRIIIWSSMKKSTVEEIVHYLFRDLLQPFEVLGQDNCRKIKIYQGKYLKVIGGSKEIFLKNLSKAFFIGSIQLDEENMIIIDDSPEKCVCNDRRNCLFLETWTPLVVADEFLVCTLRQWLLQLHTDCTHRQLWDFVNRNRIGVPPLAAYSQVLGHIVKGMALSSRNLYKKYEILGVPSFEILKI